MNRSTSAAPPEGVPPEGARRSRRVAIPAVATALALGVTQIALAAPGHAATAARVAVGHAPTIPGGAKAAAAPAGSNKLTLDLELNTPNSAALATVANEVNDPKSPYYHRFLGKGDVAKDFGAPADEVAAVDAALKAAGLTPGQVSADGLFIPVTATIAQAKAAFGTDFAGYQVGSRSVYANTSAPKFDATVAPDIAGVVGLDNIAYAVPQYVKTGKQGTTGFAPAAQRAHASVTPKVGTTSVPVPTCNSINSYFGSPPPPNPPLHNGTDYYTADAVSNIYGINSLLAGGDDGTGVTVAVFELENYDPQGYNALSTQCYGSRATVSEVPVDGGPANAPDLRTGVGVESALDLENIADLAPGVSIIDYAGPDWQGATNPQILDTYNKIVNDDTAKVVSTSWGLCEAHTDSAFVSAENTIFAKAAVQGQTVLAAAGDAGSTDCYDPNVTTPDHTLSVDDPASQPTVLGVGGTSMSGLTSPTQSAWNSVQTVGTTHYYGATGGGVSTLEGLPGFQAGVTASGYNATCAKAAGTGCREVPDVSALADPIEGYVIAIYDSSIGGIPLTIIGGTSGAAPVWAAIYALADASPSCRVNGSAGEAAPALYAAGTTAAGYSVFRDIVGGSNGIPAYSAPYSYPATNGYDMATGWGVPNAPGVVNTACKVGIVSPASYYTPVGPTRILDTRSNLGANGPVPANGGTIKVQITGANGVAAANVTAVVLNVTVTANASSGYATAYPDGSPAPATSNLNWVPNQTVPNLVVVPVGQNGMVDITNSSGSSAQFIADLAGYFTSDATAATDSTYTAVGPVRAMDTRKGIGVPAGAVPSGGVVSLPVGGTTIGTVTVPAGITAVAMNVTVTAPAVGGYVTVYPNQTAGGVPVTRPTVSNLNFSRNQTIANMVIVPVGADGKVDFYNGAGATQLVADVAGYFSTGTSGAKYHALGPDRIVDTRIALGSGSTAPVGANGTLTLPIRGGVTAILANLTVAQTAAGGYLTAYPDNVARPTVSNLNFLPGQAVPNLAIVPNSGKIDFFNGSGGSLRLIVDLGGYFSAS